MENTLLMQIEIKSKSAITAKEMRDTLQNRFSLCQIERPFFTEEAGAPAARLGDTCESALKEELLASEDLCTGAPHLLQYFASAPSLLPHSVQKRTGGSVGDIRVPHSVQNEAFSLRSAPQFLHFMSGSYSFCLYRISRLYHYFACFQAFRAKLVFLSLLFADPIQKREGLVREQIRDRGVAVLPDIAGIDVGVGAIAQAQDEVQEEVRRGFVVRAAAHKPVGGEVGGLAGADESQRVEQRYGIRVLLRGGDPCPSLRFAPRLGGEVAAEAAAEVAQRAVRRAERAMRETRKKKENRGAIRPERLYAQRRRKRRWAYGVRAGGPQGRPAAAAPFYSGISG